MTTSTRVLDRLHDATHQVPGVPAHAKRPTGHQGTPGHGRTAHAPVSGHRSPGRTWNHAAARRPRVLVAWQRRIAAFFGQEV